jgi:hypothetical protein
MICPGKLCRQEIPGDSLYCDQCGIQILRCSKCGNPGASKFCGKCGGAMMSNGADAPPQPVPQTAASAGTIVMPQTVKKLLFCHPDGWNMEITDGDILGRTNGNHTDKLGAIPVISGAHAKITYENNGWFITDQKSTNKTYVGGIIVQPEIPAPLKNNDVVQLANIKFIVREA